MTSIETVHTILDAPDAPPLTGWSAADEARLRASLARTAALVARPEVVAVVAQARALTEAGREALHKAYCANYHVHRITQTNLKHRVNRENPDGPRALLSATERVWRAVTPPDSRWWGATEAACDAVFAHLAGDLLAEDEARLFNQPWNTTVHIR